ncbi:MAG: PDZ domain-containing protein [Epsilonproteobacteria bacterium]|nr:PDZ domain-containing protein [Campylobacterota bacterium]
MSRVFSGLFANCFYLILWMIFIAKSLALGLSFVLPDTPLAQESNFKDTVSYVRVNAGRVFKLRQTTEKVTTTIKKEPTLLVKDMVLKGVFVGKENSFAVIALKNKKNEIKIVAKNDIFNGYKLIKVYPWKVILRKNSKLYTLVFKDKKEDLDDLSGMDFEQDDGSVILNKDDVYKYVNNFDKIWKEIRIDDVRKNGKLNGFIVKWIRKGSIFSKIGLKKGDKIVKVDGKPLKSYADAFVYYEKIKKKELDLLRLTVLRNNKEKEIEYELY